MYLFRLLFLTALLFFFVPAGSDVIPVVTVPPIFTQKPDEPPTSTTDVPVATQTPDTSTTLFTGKINMFIPFVIWNTQGFNAADLQSRRNVRRLRELGPILEGSNKEFQTLKQAWENMVADIVSQLTGQRARDLDHRRRLRITLVENSSMITSIVDLPCPKKVTDEAAQCQLVVGTYRLNLEDEDEDGTKNQFWDMTRQFIEDNKLQSAIEDIDSNSAIKVAGVDETNDDDDDREDDNTEGDTIDIGTSACACHDPFTLPATVVLLYAMLGM
jgi:hypothetical protein